MSFAVARNPFFLISDVFLMLLGVVFDDFGAQLKSKSFAPRLRAAPHFAFACCAKAIYSYSHCLRYSSSSHHLLHTCFVMLLCWLCIVEAASACRSFNLRLFLTSRVCSASTNACGCKFLASSHTPAVCRRRCWKSVRGARDSLILHMSFLLFGI